MIKQLISTFLLGSLVIGCSSKLFKMTPETHKERYQVSETVVINQSIESLRVRLKKLSKSCSHYRTSQQFLYRVVPTGEDLGFYTEYIYRNSAVDIDVVSLRANFKYLSPSRTQMTVLHKKGLYKSDIDSSHAEMIVDWAKGSHDMCFSH